MSGRDNPDIATDVIGGAVVIVASITVSLSWAFVTHKLWGWFAVPLGAPVLALPHIWGLMILKGMVFFRAPRDDEKPQWSLMLTYPLIAWGLGALAAGWLS